MLTINLIVIIILLGIVSIKATEYYKVTLNEIIPGVFDPTTGLTSPNGAITSTNYWVVDSNVVTGIYFSSTDFDKQTNNQIVPPLTVIIGGLYNDNKVDYTSGAANYYGIDSGGITWKRSYNNYNNLYSTGSGFSVEDVNVVNFPTTLVIETYIPPTTYHYEVIITTTTATGSIAINVYFTVFAYYVVSPGYTSTVTGVYNSITDFNAQTNNQIILPANTIQTGFDLNDNKFSYIYGGATYGIDGNGISFTYQGTKTNVYQSSGIFYIYFDGASTGYEAQVAIYVIPSLPATAVPTATPTALPTLTPTATPVSPYPEYYQVTITTSNAAGPLTIDTYITVLANVVIGIYLSISDYNYQTNSYLLPTGTGGFAGNDDVFIYTAGAPYYGIDGNGISFTYQGTKTNIYVNGNLGTLYDGSSVPYFAQLAVTQIQDPTYTTDTPTAIPTDAPTFIPTKQPTKTPTRSPTKAPTIKPTASPTTISKQPTSKPSASPTSISKQPTSKPSASPTSISKQPTSKPTASPTSVSKQPTSKPTASPTSISKQPTSKPTASPTSIFKAPTHTPTKPPTHSPSKQPTHTPTKAPTATPTIIPTASFTTLP